MALLTGVSPIQVQTVTLEEQVGQMLMVHFHGEVANEEAATLIQDIHVGGFTYYSWANGLHSSHQIYALSESLQNLAARTRVKIPLLIASDPDYEGKIVIHVNNGFTLFPGNRALGETDNLQLAEKSAFFMGKELRSVGVTMNLGPVFDVHSNPKNPVIGIRSFGETAEKVSRFASAMVEGYCRAGILTVGKQFPGSGDVRIDACLDLPVSEKTLEQLRDVEFVPFFENKPDAIMTGHILAPKIDPDRCCTVSKIMIDILRTEGNFDGVVMTDALGVTGLLKNFPSIDEAAICAIEAGHDIVFLGGRQVIGLSKEPIEFSTADIRRIHASIVSAVRTGRISQSRIDQATRRIFSLKHRYPAMDLEEPGYSVSLAGHQALAKIISYSAFKIDKRADFSSDVGLVIAPEIFKEAIAQTKLRQLMCVFFLGINPLDSSALAAYPLIKEVNTVFIFTYNAWKHENQKKFVQTSIDLQKKVVVIAMRDPIDLEFFPDAHCVIATYSSTFSSIKSVADYIMKNL